jgi:hypothetical protein
VPARRPHPLLALALGVVTSAALSAPSPALAVEADTPDCDAPVPSTTQPGYTVADPDCDVRGENPFSALPGATAYTGIEDGEAYRIEVPDDWNGDLVVYAHGYRGTGTTVYVDSPTLRQHFLDRGYAWAASSYETNGYDVEQGVEDSHELVERFRRVVPGRKDLDEVLIHGVSMGGHITAVEVERYPDTWSAAYPVCGVLGDTELYDYFLGANVTGAALAGAEIDYAEAPSAEGLEQWRRTVSQEIVPELFTQRPTTTAEGQAWAAVLQQLSGGERPGFASSFAFWNSFGFAPLQDLPFLFGVYPGLNGGRAGGEVATGNIAGNVGTVYQLDDDPSVSPPEAALNAAVLRVERDPDATGIPRIEATAEVPVLSLHTIGDLFVPFSMEQIYAAEAEENGTEFVSRAIRANGHCDFTVGELAKGFDDLVRWTVTGLAPAGDDVLDPEAVADPTFGCRFTESSRPTFAAEQACPTFPDVEGSVHARAIRAQLAAGVLEGFGNGTFRADASITRGQVASIVARALDLEPGAGALVFSDTAGTTHQDAIRALAEAGLVEGYADGTFRPDQLVSRAQLAPIIARALGQEDAEGDCFPDVAGVHEAAICALADLGIATGFADGTYRPALPVSRGQAASLLDRAFG